jgi:hypothetical protein
MAFVPSAFAASVAMALSVRQISKMIFRRRASRHAGVLGYHKR